MVLQPHTSLQAALGVVVSGDGATSFKSVGVLLDKSALNYRCRIFVSFGVQLWDEDAFLLHDLLGVVDLVHLHLPVCCGDPPDGSLLA